MMRLQRLDLELFGHFTGKTLDFGSRVGGESDFHLVYGSNESGKTTVMEGYLRLLYGFRPREPYDFKHTRPNLKVSGALMLNDTVREFTRLSVRNNSLIDTTGTPLSEALIQSELAGLSIDDYRKLFCLDDATIEAGGDEIVNSQGEIGRLLFSASSAVSDLSEILNIVDKRAANLYRRGSNRSTFAQIRREIKAISEKIRDADIGLTGYRNRKKFFEDVKAVESELRAQRHDMQKEQTLLAATIKALPVFTKIADLESELEPLVHFPTDLDIDAELLVELSQKRAVLEVEHKRLEELVDKKVKTRDAIEYQPKVVKGLIRLNDLRELRARCGTATTDLPQHQVQIDGVIEDMQRSLLVLGIESTVAPDQYVFDLTELRRLEELYTAVVEIETSLVTAKEEQNSALQKTLVAEKLFSEIPVVSGNGQDLRSILDSHCASSILAEANRATEALRLAYGSARAALSKLTSDGVKFDTVPELPANADEASKLARDIDAAKTAVVSAEDDLADALKTAYQIDSHISALNDTSGLITDEEAGASRDKRDELWRTHRVELSDSTAESFESAMRMDDAIGLSRHSQVNELAEVRQHKVALAKASSSAQSKKAALETSRSRLATTNSVLKSYLSAVGLNEGISAAGFADWIRNAEMARELTISAESEEVTAQSALHEAESLRQALALVLNAPDGKLDALVAMAEKSVVELDKSQLEIRTVQKVVDTAKAEHQKRSGRTKEYAEALSGARKVWQSALDDTFGDAGRAIQFPRAFDSLRSIRELNEKRLGLRHQIESMQTDLKTFEKSVDQLISHDSELAGQSMIDAYDSLVSRAEAARKDEEARSQLTTEIDDAQGKLKSVRDELDDMAAQVRTTAAIFANDIPTSSVEELRQAVLKGNRAISLRDEIGTLWSELCSLLGVTSNSDVESKLNGQTLPEIQAAKSEVEHDLSGLNESVDTAIENRTHAKAEFDAISGDSDVASLVSQKQTLELEMEDVILNYFKLTVGHQLADKAILRYRDEHRSGMMRAAKTAFSELTNNAYCDLTTQVNGTTETLVAIQSSDGAAKEAQAMSKGTRFQLYLALRAAAYDQMAENGTILPFFCDDIFETFDEDRTRSACGMMHRIGQTGQAIYLTHHRHVVDIAREVCGDDVQVHDISKLALASDFTKHRRAA